MDILMFCQSLWFWFILLFEAKILKPSPFKKMNQKQMHFLGMQERNINNYWIWVSSESKMSFRPKRSIRYTVWDSDLEDGNTPSNSWVHVLPGCWVVPIWLSVFGFWDLEMEQNTLFWHPWRTGTRARWTVPEICLYEHYPVILFAWIQTQASDLPWRYRKQCYVWVEIRYQHVTVKALINWYQDL